MQTKQRVIKFRAWDIQKKRMIQVHDMSWWVTPHLPREVDQCLALGEDSYSIENTKNKNNFILQQFTGLTDKNGKEIYEGDVIKKSNIPVIYEIVFENGAYFMKSIGGAKTFYCGLYGLNEYVEIIGNIFSKYTESLQYRELSQ